MTYTILPSCTGCTACLKICPVAAISGERKSLHTIAGALCIDCGACGRICPVQAVLDPAGEVCGMLKRSLWLQPSILAAQCISCGVCLEVCPAGVLDFAEPAAPLAHAVARLADPRGCIGCSFCAIDCPVDAILMRPARTEGSL